MYLFLANYLLLRLDFMYSTWLQILLHKNWSHIGYDQEILHLQRVRFGSHLLLDIMVKSSH